MNDYTDIIDLNRPLSKHANLGVESRAAQFAPFAALTGYDAEIRETARLTDKKIEVDDGLKDLLNSKLAKGPNFNLIPFITFLHFEYYEINFNKRQLC